MPLPRENLHDPQERVIRQLVEGSIFENLIKPREADQNDMTCLTWRSPFGTLSCVGRRLGFNRIRVEPGTIMMSGSDAAPRLATLQDVVASLPAEAARLAVLQTELESTIHFSQWNADNLPEKSRRHLHFSDLDCALDEGHPYHPAYRTRAGFTLDDHQAYAPECGRSFQLHWFFVCRSVIDLQFPAAEPDFWSAELGGDVYAQISVELAARELSFEHVTLLPMHPWQWDYLRNRPGFDWVEKRYLFPIGKLGDLYRASQSLRSLINVSREGAAIVKLPLSVINTSSKRLLEPHAVCSAPMLSNWLVDIIASDERFERAYPLAILREYAGLIAGRDGAYAGEIGVMWREHPNQHLTAGEAVVPFNALMMLEPDGMAFIEPWVAEHGLDAWLDRLLEIAVLPVWHLLVCHGIATEAHGQNMLLVHANGWPTRIILRDFHESVEFSSPFLKEPDREPDLRSLYPAYATAQSGDYYWLDDLDGLRELAMDTLFVFNLSEIAHLMSHSYGLNERKFWERVANLIHSYGERENMSERQAQLGWQRPFIKTESLITRKLLAAQSEYHHLVANALAVSRTPEGSADA